MKQLSLTIKNLRNLLPVCFCSSFAYRKIQFHFLKKRRLFLNCVIERAVNLFIYFLHSFFLSLLFWPLLSTHCTCKGLSLRLITLIAHTHLAGLPWMRDRPVAEVFTCTSHNIHRRKISVHPVEFEPENPASERPQAYTVIQFRTNKLSDAFDMVHLQTNHVQFHKKGSESIALYVFKS